MERPSFAAARQEGGSSVNWGQRSVLGSPGQSVALAMGAHLPGALPTPEMPVSSHC